MEKQKKNYLAEESVGKLMLPLKFGIYDPLYSAPVAGIVSFIVVIAISIYLFV